MAFSLALTLIRNRRCWRWQLIEYCHHLIQGYCERGNRAMRYILKLTRLARSCFPARDISSGTSEEYIKGTDITIGKLHNYYHFLWNIELIVIFSRFFFSYGLSIKLIFHPTIIVFYTHFVFDLFIFKSLAT